MKVRVLNTITSVERIVEVHGYEVLIGSDIECDLVLEGAGILGQHLRLAVIGDDVYKKAERDEYGDIAPVYKPSSDLFSTETDTKGLRPLTEDVNVGHYVVSFHSIE